MPLTAADDHLVLVGLVDIEVVARLLEHARKQRQAVAGRASAFDVACDAAPPTNATANAPQATPTAR